MLTSGAVEAQLKALVDGWLGIIQRADQEKRAFNAIAAQCVSFAGGKSSSNFMWKDAYKAKYLGKGIASPKIETTIMKGFEYLSIFGPLLYWQYPNRKVESNRVLDIDVAALSRGDQMRQMQYEQLAQAQQQEDSLNGIRNELYETVLNYCQREQYGGGLATHSKLAINEGLIKGRGCTWTEKYHYPGSGRTLVGSFFDPVSNMLIDPDCSDPTLTRAKFIVRKHKTPYWELEQRFNLPKNYLRDKGNFESGASQGRQSATGSKSANPNNDIVEWYEIFSKCGVGTRIDGTKTSLDSAFEEVVGDYAYLCVCKLCGFPLNAPAWKLADESLSDEEVSSMFEWPIPFWADDKWPVSVLDFYPDPETCWPVAPLAPALGELTCLNILIACFLDLAYANKQQIIAYLDSAEAEVKAALESSESIVHLKITGAVNKSINEVVQFLNRDKMNTDLLDAIQFVLQRFEERTGLSEVMYGAQSKGSAARSAEDARNRNDRASIRPDFMATVVADWQTEMAEKEKIALRFCVTAQDVAPLLGPLGAQAWHDLVEMEDPDVVFRGMKCTCAASDMRKPDKAREASNIQQLAPQLLPVLAQIATARQDYSQLNAMFESMGDALEQDLSGWMIPPETPNADQQMIQQQIQQLELEQMAADADAKRAEAESKRAGIESDQNEAHGNAAQAEQKMGIDAAVAGQKMQLTEAQSQQKRQMADVQAQQKMQMASQQHVMQLHQQDQQSQMASAQGAQNIMAGAQQAGDKRQQAAAEFFQRLQQQGAARQLNMVMRAQEAKANPAEGKA